MSNSDGGEASIEDVRQYHAQVEKDLPRNFMAILVHGMLGLTGFRLMYAPTFVPAYVFSLSESKVAVGFALGAQFVGMALSSIWGATMIEHRDRVMKIVVGVGWLVRLQIFGLALSAFVLSGHFALIAACTCLMLFGFFSGMQGVAFNVMMSKIIPVNKRGKLVGMRNFLGGLIAAGVAYLGGQYLVGLNVFGNGYATTFMLSFILTSLGITGLNFVREPQALSMRAKPARLRDRLADIPAMLRGDVNYRRLFFARALGALGTAAVPFYILHVGKFVGLTGDSAAALGYFSLAFLLPQTISNLVWGKIADVSGYRLVFLLSVGLWCLSTVLLIFSTTMPLFLIAFCGLGSGLAGYQVASQNFVLEFGEPHELPMLIAVSDTASHVTMVIGPLLGGLPATQLDYVYVFWLAVGFKVIAIFTVSRLQEPRRRLEVKRMEE
jgi:MFS family permease